MIAKNTPVGPSPSRARRATTRAGSPTPEADQVEPGRRPGVAGAVERLRQHHAVRVEQEAERDDAQAAHRVAGHRRVGGERPTIERGATKKTTPTPPRKTALYAPARQTDGSARSGFRAPRLWPTIVAAALLRPHDGSSAKMMSRMRDRVARERVAAERRDDPHQPDPARHPDQDLERRRAREPEDLPHHAEVEPQVPPRDRHPARRGGKARQREERADRRGRSSSRPPRP